MVFPWLVIGASAALEASRRTQPPTSTERQVRQLKDVEHALLERQQTLQKDLQEAVSVLASEREAHDLDKQRLDDMDRIQREIEARMMEMQQMTDELVKENEQLKVEKSLLEEEARYAQKENQSLRQRNEELESKMEKIVRESEAEMERVSQLLDELKDAVADSLTTFTKGGSPLEFQTRMERLGIKLDCSLDDLQQISRSSVATEALEDAVTSQFNSQMSLVMEDRSKLEHLMGIAKNLRVKGPSEEQRTPLGTPSRAVTSQSNSVPDSSKSGSMALGGGILSALAFVSKDGATKDTPAQPASIPSATDVPLVGETDGLDNKMQTLSVTAGPQDEVLATTGADKVSKAQKPFFKFGFKGLPEPKKSKPRVPSAHSLDVSGDDGAIAGSSDLIRK